MSSLEDNPLLSITIRPISQVPAGRSVQSKVSPVASISFSVSPSPSESKYISRSQFHSLMYSSAQESDASRVTVVETSTVLSLRSLSFSQTQTMMKLPAGASSPSQSLSLVDVISACGSAAEASATLMVFFLVVSIVPSLTINFTEYSPFCT